MIPHTDMSLNCAACGKNFIPDTDNLWNLCLEKIECPYCEIDLEVWSTETYDSGTNVEIVDFYTKVVEDD